MFSVVDECLEENDCDDMATCTDQLYSYTCRCNTIGFHGTGKECTGQNETVAGEVSIANRESSPQSRHSLYT